MNILCLGEFPTIEEIGNILERNDQAEMAHVEKLFQKGQPLERQTVSELLTGINSKFTEHLVVSGDEPIARFGCDEPKYLGQLKKYKLDVMNVLSTWQHGYEASKGKEWGQLAARAAYAMRTSKDGKAARPLLTVAYITAVNWILQRIPSVIQEVSRQLHLFLLYTMLRMSLHRPHIILGRYVAMLQATHSHT